MYTHQSRVASIPLILLRQWLVHGHVLCWILHEYRRQESSVETLHKSLLAPKQPICELVYHHNNIHNLKSTFSSLWINGHRLFRRSALIIFCRLNSCIKAACFSKFSASQISSPSVCWVSIWITIARHRSSKISGCLFVSSIQHFNNAFSSFGRFVYI